MKQWIVFFTFINFGNAFGNSQCTPLNQNYFSSEPDKASIITVVHFTKKDNSLRVFKSWTDSPFKFLVESGQSFSHENLEEDFYYLLLSKELSDEHSLVNKCNSELIPMTKAKDVIHKLAISKKFQNSKNIAWKYCEQKSDCEKVRWKCGVEVINKMYVTQFLKSHDSSEKKVCFYDLGVLHPSADPVVSCIKNFCIKGNGIY